MKLWDVIKQKGSKYMDYIDYGPKSAPKKGKSVEVRQLGLQQVVVVRTRANGGI
jgi:hypothetical protein